jgi:hypothetical protein
MKKTFLIAVASFVLSVGHSWANDPLLDGHIQKLSTCASFGLDMRLSPAGSNPYYESDTVATIYGCIGSKLSTFFFDQGSTPERFDAEIKVFSDLLNHFKKDSNYNYKLVMQGTTKSGVEISIHKFDKKK